MKPGIRNVPTPYRAGDRPKGEQVFMQKLHKFMAGRGTPIGRLPSLGFKQRNYYLEKILKFKSKRHSRDVN